ncbi:unnamed protein product, partial [Rotaria magnacalcarata]
VVLNAESIKYKIKAIRLQITKWLRFQRFIVVKFLDNNECGVIHQNWLVGEDECRWPIGSGINESWLRDGTVYATWPIFKCSVKSSTNAKSFGQKYCGQLGYQCFSYITTIGLSYIQDFCF